MVGLDERPRHGWYVPGCLGECIAPPPGRFVAMMVAASIVQVIAEARMSRLPPLLFMVLVWEIRIYSFFLYTCVRHSEDYTTTSYPITRSPALGRPVVRPKGGPHPIQGVRHVQPVIDPPDAGGPVWVLPDQGGKVPGRFGNTLSLVEGRVHQHIVVRQGRVNIARDGDHPV